MSDLSPSQQSTLRTLVLAEPSLATARQNGDDQAIANWLNANALPDHWVYKSSVTNEEIGDAMNGTEIAGLASLAMQRAQMLANYSNGTQNPSRFDRRDAFARIFSGAGGATTRAALEVLWRRLASVAEKALATGAGSTGSPATAGWEGKITPEQASLMR
jgi:hypothetical protein